MNPILMGYMSGVLIALAVWKWGVWEDKKERKGFALSAFTVLAASGGYVFSYLLLNPAVVQ